MKVLVCFSEFDKIILSLTVLFLTPSTIIIINQFKLNIMNLIVLGAGEGYAELIRTKIDSVVMFKKHELSINITDKEELMKLIVVLTDHDVLFRSCGLNVTFIPRHDNYQNAMFKIECL